MSAPARQALSREALRGEVGYVGHATLLYGELSARENLAFAARLHGLHPSQTHLDEILADFALQDVAERRAGGFSRGMAQRLSIARAVVHEPALLLLDEPFTGLDEMSAERLSTRLAAQRARGRTLVVVTHDPRRAVELADRALVLDRGRVHATPGRAEGEAGFDVESLRETLAALATQPGTRSAEARTL
jgi:ABC-type multidrug transport system ATPase subunit